MSDVLALYGTRAWRSICFFLGETFITRRKPWLTSEDYAQAKKVLKKGDIILVGTYRTIAGFFIAREIFNHAIYYAG